MKTTERKEVTTFIFKRMMYVTMIGLMMIQFSSCTKDKDKSSEKASLSVQLTDAPANYDAVMIDVQGVEIKGDIESAVMLNTAAGMYNPVSYTHLTLPTKR